MRQSGTREALRQLWTGNDFEPPERMLADLTPEQATAIPAGAPYSIADQVGHLVYWQERWLERIHQKPRRRTTHKEDWPRIDTAAWPATRDALLAGLSEAAALARDPEMLTRPLGDETGDSVLLMLALHGAYHLGQIGLLRQLVKTWPPRGSDEAW